MLEVLLEKLDESLELDQGVDALSKSRRIVFVQPELSLLMQRGHEKGETMMRMPLVNLCLNRTGELAD